MKNICTLLLCISILFACGKDDDTTNPSTEIVNNSISCNIDGKVWLSDKEKASALLLFDENIEIEGFEKSTGNKILLAFKKMDVVTGKTILIDDNISNTNSATLTITDANVNPIKDYIGTSGLISITSFNGKIIKGTFSFEASLITDISQKAQITEGKFEMTIKE